MILEHIGLSEINGPSGRAGRRKRRAAMTKWSSCIWIDGSTRVGRVVEVEGDRCVIQVFEGTRGITPGQHTARC